MKIEDCLFKLIDWDCDGSAVIDYRQLHIASTESLEMLADDDKDNFKGVLKSIVSLAAKQIESDLTGMVQIAKFRAYGSGCWGVPGNNLVTYNNWQGFELKIKPSKNLIVDIKDLIFFSGQTQQVLFTIADQYSLLYSHTLNLAAGVNMISLPITIAAHSYKRIIKIGYMAANTLAYEVSSRACQEDCGCYADAICCVPCNGLSPGSATTGGFMLRYDVTCGMEPLICLEAKRLETALIYAVGMHQIYTSRGTSRVNRFSQILSVEGWADLLPVYKENYEKALKAFVKTLNFCDDCCFDCQPSIQHRYVYP